MSNYINMIICNSFHKLLAASLTTFVMIASPQWASANSGEQIITAERDGVPSVPEDNVCGVNSLYMLLRSWGYSVTPDVVRRNTPRGFLGTNLRELKDSAGTIGVDTKVYLCGIEDLGRGCELPVIAYMQNKAQLGPAFRNYQGHFILVYAVDPGPNGLVHWYDGTYGVDFNRPKDKFVQWWTGYVLGRPSQSKIVRLALWCTATHMAVWPLAFWYFRGRNARASIKRLRSEK